MIGEYSRDRRAPASRAPSTGAGRMGGEARLHAIPGGGGQESSTAAVHVLLGTIERLRQVVEAETLTLKENKPADLRDFNARKNQGLLELTRAMRGMASEGMGDEASARLRALRAALQRNSEVLKTHVDAVQEICAMMAGAIQEAESDGTYTIASRRRDAR